MNKRFINTFQKFCQNSALDMQPDIKENATLDSCGFDSLDRVGLIEFLEDEYGIGIDAAISGSSTVGQLCSIVATLDEKHGFVDLGLTSGTMWAKQNVELDGKKLFTFDEAIARFEDKIPTATQVVELATECKSEWINGTEKIGRRFIGPNGNSIFIPADGYNTIDGRFESAGKEGNIWSKTPSINFRAKYAFNLYFLSGSVCPLYTDSRAFGFSVRPVRE